MGISLAQINVLLAGYDQFRCVSVLFRSFDPVRLYSIIAFIIHNNLISCLTLSLLSIIASAYLRRTERFFHSFRYTLDVINVFFQRFEEIYFLFFFFFFYQSILFDANWEIYINEM